MPWALRLDLLTTPAVVDTKTLAGSEKKTYFTLSDIQRQQFLLCPLKELNDLLSFVAHVAKIFQALDVFLNMFYHVTM